jgi:putative DNA primase/helicase
MKNKPTYLRPIFENIPNSLKQYSQWVLWKAEYDAELNKWKKVPYNAETGKRARSNDSSTWGAFDKIKAVYDPVKYDGIGFVLSDKDPFVGLDLDGCHDPDSAETELWADDIIHNINSYTEYSPSGRGIRSIIEAEKPPGRCRKDKIEIYGTLRYLTITGHVFNGFSPNIEKRQAEITALYKNIFQQVKKTDSIKQVKGNTITPLDQERLRQAFSSKHGKKIERLYNGDSSGYESQSEADQALCFYLAYWCERDAERIDRIFRTSKLYRIKWDKKHYCDGATFGQRCIENALIHVTKTAKVKSIEETLLENKEDAKSFDDIEKCILDFSTLMLSKLPERPKLFSWLPRGGLIMVYGPRGIGKTFFSIFLACSLCDGSPFIKWPAPPPTGVLYVDGEMPLKDLKIRIAHFLSGQPKAPFLTLSSEKVYSQKKTDLCLTNQIVQDQILDYTDKNRDLGVVIIDNISCLFTGLREDNKQDWERVIPFLLALRHRGIAVVLIHHAGKSGDQRGTSGREDMLDTVIKLKPVPNLHSNDGARFIIEFTKNRGVYGKDVEQIEVKLNLDIEGFWTWKSYEESNYERMLSLAREGIDTVTDMAIELGVSKGLVSRLKNRAVDAGILIRGRNIKVAKF